MRPSRTAAPLARLAALAALAFAVAGCSAGASEAPSMGDWCEGNAFSRADAVEICVAAPSERANGLLLGVTFLNPRTDAAAVVTPAYELLADDGAHVVGKFQSLLASEAGLLVPPGGGWTQDYGLVPSGTARAVVTATVVWRPGKGAAYEAPALDEACLEATQFTGCSWANGNGYALRVRARIDLLSASTGPGGGRIERILVDGPDVLLPARSSGVAVPPTQAQLQALQEWLAGDATHGFRPGVVPSLDQPDFPAPAPQT